MVLFSILKVISQNGKTAPESLFFREKPRPGEIEILVSENPSSVTEAQPGQRGLRGSKGGCMLAGETCVRFLQGAMTGMVENGAKHF